MKIAITSTGATLDDQVEARFGRCAYFLIVETDSMALEAIENPNVAAGGGAGVQSAQLMADKGVKAVLTGNCGPNAFQVFGAAGVQVLVGVSGTVRDAVEKYKQGTLGTASEANVNSHFGMGGGGMGRGMGGGMGGGRGMGRGMGGGMGGGRGMAPAAAPGTVPEFSAPASDVDSLKAQAKVIEDQLKAVNEKIAGLQGQTTTSPLVAVLDAEKCVGCGVCVPACPVEAISMNDMAEVNSQKCTGCGRCVTECPQDALSLHARS